MIKTYVELGIGIGILASMAFHAERDRGLRRLDASPLFPANTTRIAVRQGIIYEATLTALSSFVRLR